MIKLTDETYIKLWRYHAERRSQAFKQGDLQQLSFDDTIGFLIDKEVNQHE